MSNLPRVGGAIDLGALARPQQQFLGEAPCALDLLLSAIDALVNSTDPEIQRINRSTLSTGEGFRVLVIKQPNGDLQIHSDIVKVTAADGQPGAEVLPGNDKPFSSC